jgi:hypothetical protein
MTDSRWIASAFGFLTFRTGGLHDRDFGLNIIVIDELLHDDVLVYEVSQWRVGIDNVAKGVQTKGLDV